MNPKVTVAISMYKVENYVRQCIESIIAQTYRNLEIILVDDGSPDNSGKIADEYAKNDSRVIVVHQKNAGLGAGRNAAINIATGDYISFVDADDYLAPDFVEYMLNLITSQNADIAISRVCFTTSDLKQETNDYQETYTSEKAIAEFFLPYMKLGAWNKIYSMAFLNKNQLRFVPELTTGEGLQFITHAASYANKVAVGHHKAYIYRLNNPGSATSAANVERQGKGSLDTMAYIKEHLPLTSKKTQDAYEWQLWNCYRYCLRQIIESNTKESYLDLYHKCIRELRKGSFKIFSIMGLRHKCEAIVVFISPVFFAKLQIWKKNRRQA